MSRFLFFLVLLLSHHFIRTQVVQEASYSRVNKTSNLVCINSKSFYLEERGSGAESTQNWCYLVGHDAAGQEIFSTQITATWVSVSKPVKVVKTLDKNLLVLYYGQMECDVFRFTNIFVAKLDTTGHLIFKSSALSHSLNPYDGIPMDLTEHNDSSIYLAVKNEIYKFDKSGQLLSMYASPVQSITCISTLQNGNIFLSGYHAGQLKNIEMDTAHNIVQAVVSSDAINSIRHGSSGQFFALSTGGKILKLSPMLQQTGATNSAALRFSDFDYRNDSLFTVGYDPVTGRPWYGILNNNLTTVYSSTNNLERVYPSGIGLNNQNRLCIVSKADNLTGSWYNNFTAPMAYRSYFQFGKTDSFYSAPDVGVISFTVKDFYQYWTTRYMLDAEVVVKNFGNQPVSGFFLCSNQYTMYCPGVNKTWINESLQPGATATIQTGWLHLSGESPFTGGNKKLFCFYTAIPDHEVDNEPSNDRFCDSVSVLPTGIFESNVQEDNFFLYPNPFNAEFILTSETLVKELQIINTLGQKVLEVQVNSRELRLNTETLSKGIYFLVIQTEKGTTIRKLIKAP